VKYEGCHTALGTCCCDVYISGEKWSLESIKTTNWNENCRFGFIEAVHKVEHTKLQSFDIHGQINRKKSLVSLKIFLVLN
jgi:hypothetical protein